MKYNVQDSPQGPLASPDWDERNRVETSREFFDLIMEAPAPTLVVDRHRITEAFFELRTGLAGDVLQKVSNYRRRLVILGDFTQESSKSLNDFIRESNRTGQVVFCPDLPTALGLLKPV